jgi:hypothetical protein
MDGSMSEWVNEWQITLLFNDCADRLKKKYSQINTLGLFEVSIVFYKFDHI